MAISPSSPPKTAMARRALDAPPLIARRYGQQRATAPLPFFVADTSALEPVHASRRSPSP